jgi:hypothetical protein
VWEQIGRTETEMPNHAFVGVAATPEDPTYGDGVYLAHARCTCEPSDGSPLPRVTVKPAEAKKGDESPGTREHTVTVETDGEVKAFYTLDGGQPDQESTPYSAPIRVTGPGRHVLRVRTYRGSDAGDVVVQVILAAR